MQNIEQSTLKILDNPDIFASDANTMLSQQSDSVGQLNYEMVTQVADKVMGDSYPENNIPF